MDAPETQWVITALLELVMAVASDAEVVAMVHHLVKSGRVRLVGNFNEADSGLAA